VIAGAAIDLHLVASSEIPDPRQVKRHHVRAFVFLECSIRALERNLVNHVCRGVPSAAPDQPLPPGSGPHTASAAHKLACIGQLSSASSAGRGARRLY
jgi:hypothetical protein